MPFASLCSVPSLHWGSSIHLLTFCAFFVAKSSAKVDRLTVTSVSELETDSRLVFPIALALFCCPDLQQQIFQTSNSNPTHCCLKESIGFVSSKNQASVWPSA